MPVMTRKQREMKWFQNDEDDDEDEEERRRRRR